MEQIKFENGVKINITHKNQSKNDVILFESYVFDLEDMLPLRNLVEAQEAGASIPQNYFKVISINKDSCEISFSKSEVVYTLKPGEALQQEDTSLELINIRFEATAFDDWEI